MPELAARHIATETSAAAAHGTHVTGLTGRFDSNLNYDVMYYLALAPGFALPRMSGMVGAPGDSIFEAVKAQFGPPRIESRRLIN
jgi:hypothetical protein